MNDEKGRQEGTNKKKVNLSLSIRSSFIHLVLFILSKYTVNLILSRSNTSFTTPHALRRKKWTKKKHPLIFLPSSFSWCFFFLLDVHRKNSHHIKWTQQIKYGSTHKFYVNIILFSFLFLRPTSFYIYIFFAFYIDFC